MKIAYSESEQVLRSIGEPPNGVIGVSVYDDEAPYFYVDSTWQGPTRRQKKDMERQLEHGQPVLAVRDVEPCSETAFGAVEAVEATTDGKTCFVLWQALVTGNVFFAQRGLPHGGQAFDRAAEILEFMREYWDAAQARYGREQAA